MTFEQALMAGIAALAVAIGILFRQLQVVQSSRVEDAHKVIEEARKDRDATTAAVRELGQEVARLTSALAEEERKP